jgi:bifunctional lysine-specific demethylase and histidyl-hydroxylase NO66
MPTTTPPTPTRTAPTPDPAASASASLARCVGDVEEFLTTQFTVAPRQWRGEGFDDLLSLSDIDGQLTGAGLRRPAVRLVRDGEVLPPSEWTRRARTGSTWIDDLVDAARLLDAFAGGATVVLQSLHRWWPPLTRFCRELESALGHAVQANAYLTPPGAAGLAPHHDTHDVFVLQVHRTKRWTVREPAVDAPLPRHHSDHAVAAGQPVLFEVELEPGDCLYLPRGFVHSAAAQEGASLHLTIGVLATTAHDVLRRLVDRAADDVAFRRSLPPGHAATHEAATRAVKEVVAELVEWLERLDPADVGGELVARAGRRRAPVLDGHLVELTRLAAVDDHTVVVRRGGVSVDLDVADDRLVVTSSDRRIEFPAVVGHVVHELLDGARHAVGELADRLDRPSRLVLVRRLVREGLLRTVDGP